MFANKALVQFIQQAQAQKKNIVCINVLETQGAAYRKSGATMIVDDSGLFVGVVSGGCFEEDIVHCATDILSKHKGKYVLHDLRIKDDSVESWGSGVGCNGLIKLWMEPFYYDEQYGSLGMALNYALNRVSKTLIRSINKPGIFNFTSIPQPNDIVFNEQAQLFYQKIHSPYSLVILGAGPGSEALVNIANTLGWHTTVCDSRAATLSFVKSADETILLESDNEVKQILKQPFDAAVVMSHNFTSDAIYLESLFASNVDYIGIMGPKKRTRTLIDSFDDRSQEYLNDRRLHNPIGLDLGGESPESIALSICAEIEAYRHKSQPASLREKREEVLYANE